MGDFVSGDFRREGMGAPGVGDSPAHLTASRPVPSPSDAITFGNCGPSGVAPRAKDTHSGRRYPET